MTWLNEVKNAKPNPIIGIKVRSKGLIIECRDYDCFLWKSDPYFKIVIAALNTSVKEGIELSQMIITAETNEKRSYTITPNKKVKQKWHPIEADDDGNCTSYSIFPPIDPLKENPFM
jgi:hypothetical protein